MTEKRILIVGDGNHQFITNYAFWLKRELGVDTTIDILSISPLKKSNLKYYDSCFQINFNSIIYNFISKIKGISRIYRFVLYNRLVSSLKEYHFVHFHFIDVDSYYLSNLFKKKFTSKIILSIWGSDLYKLGKKNERDFINTVNASHTITFTNEKSIDYFKEKFSWVKDNLRICRFGLAPLENLKSLNLSKSECKRNLGIEEDKTIITVGYNLSPAQQHLKILQQFEKEELKLLKDRVVLLFPITYGGNIKYKEKLLKKIKELPFEYCIFDSFLSDEQIAIIRKASDIMIQLQQTDQFSGSMQEHLFAKNIVITGSWLPYGTIKENGGWFLEIDEFQKINNFILEIINNPNKYEEETEFNSKVVEELSSWEKNIKLWTNIYEQK